MIRTRLLTRLFSCALIPAYAQAHLAQPAPGGAGLNEALIGAIQKANQGFVQARLNKGADANAKGNDGMTALMCAALYAGTDCMKFIPDGGGPRRKKPGGRDGFDAGGRRPLLHFP